MHILHVFCEWQPPDCRKSKEPTCPRISLLTQHPCHCHYPWRTTVTQVCFRRSLSSDCIRLITTSLDLEIPSDYFDKVQSLENLNNYYTTLVTLVHLTCLKATKLWLPMLKQILCLISRNLLRILRNILEILQNQENHPSPST
jgi:hypothetical protein